MKHFFILIVAFAFFWIGAGEPGAKGPMWKTLESTEGGFSVQMPGKPVWTGRDHKSFVGDVEEKTAKVTTAGGDYSVAYSDLPGAGKFFLGDDGLYSKAKDGLLKDAGGKALSFEKTSLAGRSARRLGFQVEGTKPRFGTAYFVLVKKRLYVLVATGPKADAKDFDRFFNSFSLIGSP